jgi:hypothetical protein
VSIQNGSNHQGMLGQRSLNCDAIRVVDFLRERSSFFSRVRCVCHYASVVKRRGPLFAHHLFETTVLISSLWNACLIGRHPQSRLATLAPASPIRVFEQPRWSRLQRERECPFASRFGLCVIDAFGMKTSAGSLNRALNLRTCSKLRLRCPVMNIETALSEPN